MTKDEWDKLEVGDFINSTNIYEVISKHTEEVLRYNGPETRYYVLGFLRMYGKSLRPVRSNHSASRIEYGRKVSRQDIIVMQSKLKKIISTAEEALEAVDRMAEITK